MLDAAQGGAGTQRAILDRRIPVVAGISMFALAASTFSNAPAMGDAAELTIALAITGIAHPTGYPLYVVVGHLFVQALHAAGVPWVLAASAWSAAGAAAGIAAFARCVQHVVALTIDERPAAPTAPLAIRLAILSPVVALALNPVWLEVANRAEVYSWSVAMLFVSAAFMMGRVRSLESGDGAGDTIAADRRTAWIWGLLCGTCLTFHLTSVLVVFPMTAALVAAYRRYGRWRTVHVLIGLCGALLPISSYGWIAWRAAHPAPFQWPVEPTLASWWMHVRGAAYSRYFGRFSPTGSEWMLIRAALLPFILPGLVLGSLFALRVRSSGLRWGLLALLGGTALQIAFIAWYSVPDPSAYFLPALMASLLVAAPLLLWIGRRSALTALSVVTVVALTLGTWSFVRVRATRALLVRVDAGFRSAWKKIPFDRGIVLWADDHYHRFVLLQLLEGQRPGLYVDDPDMLVWPARRRAFARRFGFDPVGGRVVRTREDVDAVPRIIEKNTTVPLLILPS